MRQTEEEDLRARLQQSPAPFHVAPTSTSLMAFYGSLESLWLLLTQWDSLLMGDGGAGGEGGCLQMEVEQRFRCETEQQPSLLWEISLILFGVC